MHNGGIRMLTCKECGREIKGRGKTGLCLSCAHRTKNMKRTKNRRCACGNPIADWNKTGRCKDCWHTGRKGGNTNVPGQPARGKIKCWNNHCGRWFYARPDQHRKYSLCPTCAALAKNINRYSRMVQDTAFSNSTD